MNSLARVSIQEFSLAKSCFIWGIAAVLTPQGPVSYQQPSPTDCWLNSFCQSFLEYTIMYSQNLLVWGWQGRFQDCAHLVSTSFPQLRRWIISTCMLNPVPPGSIQTTANWLQSWSVHAWFKFNPSTIPCKSQRDTEQPFLASRAFEPLSLVWHSFVTKWIPDVCVTS